MTEAIEQLKNILADLEQASSLSIKVDSREKRWKCVKYRNTYNWQGTIFLLRLTN